MILQRRRNQEKGLALCSGQIFFIVFNIPIADLPNPLTLALPGISNGSEGGKELTN